MTAFFLVFAGILGLLIGSFLNVVALRYKTGMTLGGRSKCFSCNRTLTSLELVPVFSFLFQGGKCKKCKSKISWQYSIVELSTAILFVLVFYYFPPITGAASVFTAFYLFISCLLVVITIYDIKHKIIPDALSYTFAIVAFIHIFFTPELTFFVPSLLTILAGPILALPFFLIWLLSKGKWMGLGDSKLILGIGWTLGLFPGISALILAFWIGAVVSLLWMAMVVKKFKAHYEIPFGPFLIVGMYLVLFWGIQVINFNALFPS